jgi:hypothetical protein
MARFFLNVREGGELIYDTEGGRLSFYCGSDSGSGPIGAEIMANSILAGRNPAAAGLRSETIRAKLSSLCRLKRR